MNVAANLPLRLTRRELANPACVLEGVFGSYSLAEIRAFLWDVSSKAICCGDEDLSGLGRKEMLRYYEEVERLIEAAYVLYSNTQGVFPIVDRS
jgi:hypothetical protein